MLLVAYVLGGSRSRVAARAPPAAQGREGGEGGGEEGILARTDAGRGDARITFALGVVLTFPGVSYLTALDRIAKLDYAVVPTVLIVVAFCLIQQLLLEVPLLGYAFAPERTATAVDRLSRLARPQRPPRGDDRSPR